MSTVYKDVKSEKLKLQLVRSLIGSTERVRETVKALGLRKVNSISVVENSDSTRGKLSRVSHLVHVVEAL